MNHQVWSVEAQFQRQYLDWAHIHSLLLERNRLNCEYIDTVQLAII